MNALGLLRLPRARAALSLSLGALVVLLGLGLTTTSNLLIVRAGFHPGLETLALLIVGVRFFGIARAVVRYAERLVSHDLTFRALSALRERLFRAMERLSPLQLTMTRGGDALERFQGDVETLQNAWLRAFAPFLVAGLVSILTALGLTWLHPLLGLIGLIGFALAGAFVPFAAHRAAQRLGARLTQLRGAHSGRLQDALEGAEDLLMLGATSAEQVGLQSLTLQIARTQERLGRMASWASAASSAVSWLTGLALLAAATPLIRSGLVPLEDFGVLAFAVLAAFEALLPLGAAAAGLERTQRAAARIAEPLCAASWLPSQLPTDVPHHSGSRLSFEHVGLTLGDAPILEDLSFSLEPGRWLVVIGHSGAGKSSLARLALRFCDPNSGRITLGGTDLREWPPTALRERVAWMPQHGHIFATTLRHNLLVARPQASDDELWAALEVAELSDLVRSLPLGLETRLEHDGSRLSGGERQRLLLARAWQRDSDILILDEPSANLDHETERALMRTLRRVTTGKAVQPSERRQVGMMTICSKSCLNDFHAFALVCLGGHHRPGAFRRCLRGAWVYYR